MTTWNTSSPYQTIHHKSLHLTPHSNHQQKAIQKFFKYWNIWTFKTWFRKSNEKMLLQSKIAIHTPKSAQNYTRKRNRKIICFNPPSNVKKAVAKMFFQLKDAYFPQANKLHKIFNCSTVKVSYSCTQNISQTIKVYNKKVTQIKWHHQLECNTNTNCPPNGNCWMENVIYKCTNLTIF